MSVLINDGELDIKYNRISKSSYQLSYSSQNQHCFLFKATSFPIGGVKFIADDSQQKIYSWRRTSIVPYITPITMVASLIYLIIVGVHPFTPEFTMEKYIFYGIMLAVSPLLQQLSSLRYVPQTISAALLLISITQLEHELKRKHCLIGLRILHLLSRILITKSMYDNIGLCFAYTVDVVALRGRAFMWYFLSNFSIWTFFSIAFLLLYVYKRLWYRIWDHVRILLTLNAKLEQEHRISAAVVAAHLPGDIIDHIFPAASQNCEAKDFAKDKTQRSGKCFLSSPPASTADTIENKPADGLTPDTKSSTTEVTTKTLFAAALEEGLLPAYKEGPLSLEQLQAIGGLDRRDCAVIAISLDDSNCNQETFFQNAQEHRSVFALLDKLAVEHRITCVRKFGNVWLGCVGFFKTWESQYINCHEAVLFASEASFLGNSARMSIAVDCGAITGGFLRSLNFDMFGQEIRWLLMVLELRQHGKVIVGEAVQKLLTTYQRHFPHVSSVTCTQKTVVIPWRACSDLAVNYVSNTTDIVDMPALRGFLTRTDSTHSMAANQSSGPTASPPQLQQSKQAYASASAPERISWSLVQKLISEAPEPQSERVWEISDSQPSLGQEIGEEFLLTAKQRFQLSLNDPIFDSYTDQELYDAHLLTEQKLYAVIRRVCFPSLAQFLLLWSSFTDVAGRNEYASLMSDELGDTVGVDFAEPLSLLRGWPWGQRLAVWWEQQGKASATGRPTTVYLSQRANTDSMQLSEIHQTAPTALKRKPRGKKKGAMYRKYLPRQIAPIVECDEEDDEKEAVSEKLTSFNSTVLGTVTSTNTTSSESKRSWLKYGGDARLFFYNSFANGLSTLLFYVAIAVAVTPHILISDNSIVPSLFLSAILLHAIVILVVERQHDIYGALIVLVLNMVWMIAMARHHQCLVSAYHIQSNWYASVGDFGGELVTILGSVVLIPFHIRHHFAVSAADFMILIIASVLRRAGSHSICTELIFLRFISVVILVLLTRYFWALHRTTYTSYLLEHKLLPVAVRNYHRQKTNCRALLRAFAPNVPVNKNCELYVQKPFRQAAVAALHVKVGDQIAHFLDPKDLESILDRIHRTVTKCVLECGMLSVSHFSGVYLAVACRDSAWDSVETLRFPDSHTARAVVLLRVVRSRLAALSREFQFNIQLGIGIHHGPVQMGYIGQSRFSYDVCGSVRDLAVAMASFHSDGVFASDAFDSDIRKMQSPEDIIRDVTSILDFDLRKAQRWLRIDGSFNGIQLEDFKYLCMLGQGGYGSVHLLAEKHTGIPYAIKAIELKQESKLSKMIERECSILQMVNHPNVVSLKYSFRNHNRLYLVMSYVRGGNLKQVVERDKLGLSHMLMWFAELVLAVDYLHSLGIVHRDVKPANCMIGTDGHLKLGDFGLSKMYGHTPQQLAQLIQADEAGAAAASLGIDTLSRVRKFLPLRAEDAVGGDGGTEACHRTIKVLLITMDDARADSTLLFINTTVEVAIADYDIDSDTVRLSAFEAIFIDGDYYQEDSVDLVAHFASAPFGGLPVVLCAQSEDLRLRSVIAGARVCSRLPIEALTEETLDMICRPMPLIAFSDPLYQHSMDIAEMQRERGLQLKEQQSMQEKQEKKNSPRSQNCKKFDGYVQTATMEELRRAQESISSCWLSTDHKSQRDSVAVESRSHSLVGTLHFIAPEVIRLRKYGKAVDWWACGMTFYECLVRKHLFQGEDKKTVFERIMSAPIVLDELAPFGEAMTSLVKGLLSRDIKRRLGSYGAEPIKQHKVFEKIDWTSVSTSNPVHKPAQFVNKKYRADDKDLFYGPRTDYQHIEEQHNTTSMQKYLLRKKRTKLRLKSPRSSGIRSFQQWKFQSSSSKNSINS